jgi:hypothetical protein
MNPLLPDLQQRIYRRLQADNTALRQERVELRQLLDSVIGDMPLGGIDVQDGAGSDERVGGISVEKRYLLIRKAWEKNILESLERMREEIRTYRRRGSMSLWLAKT